MKTKLLILLLIYSTFAYSQKTKSVKIDSLKTFGEYIIYEGDTLVIELREVQLLDKMKLRNKSICQKNKVLEKISNLKLDVLLTLGAGDIDTLVEPLKNLLANKN